MSAAAKPRIMPAALSALAAFCILLALGTWQLQRRAWKAGILASIDHAESAAAVPLPASPAPFAKVFATGTLMPQAALYGVEVREDANGQPREGAQVLGVLRRADARPVVVDLGWRPVGDGAADPRATPLPPGSVTVTGYARRADMPGWLSAPDDVPGKHFYTLDPARIGKELGAADVEPFTLVALGKASGPDAPVPAEALPRPPNNHLQYAFTWFGLAGALVAVFCSWLFGARKPT